MRIAVVAGVVYPTTNEFGGIMRLNKLSLLFGIGVMAASSTFAATTIDLGINGDAMVGPNFIYFSNNYPTSSTFAAAPGYGNFTVAQVNSGNVLSTAGVTNGEN